jgi:trans-aconitate 2-methyltransferase
MTTWDPHAYLRYDDERTRASADLVARIAVESPRSVIDLGCGPGNSTQVLRRRWPDARVLGLDDSVDMIAGAADTYPDQAWVLGGIESWSPEHAYDVVFSNAALQWLPGHVELTQGLFAHVAPGGALAFQIPSRSYAKVRGLIEGVASDEAWVTRMGPALGIHTMEAPEVYYDALAPGARSVDLWETTYFHVMDSQTAIVDWMSGTGLRPFLEALDGEGERARFTQMLEAQVAEAYETRVDGRVLFPFRRTFVIAYA